MTLEEYFGDWLKVLKGREFDSILSSISRKYSAGGCCPSYHNIFKAFHLCDYNSLKSVWVGMDPYPNPEYATGLLFGNPEGKTAPSLRIIKDCIYRSAGAEVNNTLEGIAKEGVLLLNFALTTECYKTGTDTLMWVPVITSLMKRLSEINSGIDYLLFGRCAAMLIPSINGGTNTILREKHPAYYSRAKMDMPTDIFDTFSKDMLERYGKKFNWK